MTYHVLDGARRQAARLAARRSEDAQTRIIYRVDADAVIIAEVFSKKTTTTPKVVIDVSQTRLRQYDDAVKGRP